MPNPNEPLTPAEAAGWSVIEQVDPDTHAQLMEWLDNHQV